MTVRDAPSAAEERIEEDKKKGQCISKKLRHSQRATNPDDILRFVPELHEERKTGGRWGSLPRGVDPPTYLLVGPAPIIDLRPVTEQRFVEYTGFTIEQAVALSECGAILLNLYNRTPEDWKGCEHLIPLIDRSMANGERVDQFFSTMDRDYFVKVEDHRQYMFDAVRKWGDSKTRRVAKSAGVGGDSQESVARAFGTRWAYLDVLDKETADGIKSLIDTGTITELAYVMRIRKHVASPISSALGGDFVRGPDDLRLVQRHSWLQSLSKVTRVPTRMEDVVADEALLEFLFEQFVGVPSVQLKKQYAAQRIVDVVATQGFRDLKNRMGDSLETLVQEMRRRDVQQSTVDDYKELIEEWREELSRHKLGGRFTVGGASLGLGALFDGLTGMSLIGTAVGGLLLVAEEFVLRSRDGIDGRLGNLAYSCIRPDHHRVLAYLDHT